MSFLAPWMLFGAAAVSVPIVLHLFFRSRYRTVPWAAMKFLLTSIEQTSRRLKFQELLLLVLRCLVLAALALAMARPITSAARGTGRGDAVDAVFLMDVSYSMGAQDGAVTRIERAKAAALDVLDHLPPHSTLQIVACADRAELVGPRSPSNLDQARQLIQNLELTSLGSDLAPGLTEAKAVLERGQLPNKEFYLFSDLQKSGWEQQASSVASEFRELKDKASIHIVRCGTRPLRNVTLVGITPQAGIPRPGERIGFAVLVRNTGTTDVQDLRVGLSADGDDKNGETQVVPTLAAGETRAVALAVRFEKSGPRVLTARILQDDLEGDNRLDQVVPVRELVNVLVVNGGAGERDAAKASSFFLNHALLPIKDLDRAKYYLQLREVEPRLASPALLAKTDLVFLVNAGMPSDIKRSDAETLGRRTIVPPDFVTELGSWVRQGHGLVIIPGENTKADAYNRALGSLLPLPIKKLHEFDVKKALNLNRGTFNRPEFRTFKDDGYFAGFNEIQVTKTLELDESAPKDEAAAKEKQTDAGGSANSAVALRYNNGWPAVAAKRVDAGEVFLLTTAADPSWSDWPISPEFIPFVQTLVAHLLHQQTDNYNAIAGETVTWHPRDKEPRNYTLKPPTGSPVRLGLPVVKDNRQVLTLPDLTRGGIYRLLAQSATQDQAFAEAGIPIAVIPDFRESQDLENLTSDQVDGRLGFSPLHAVAGGEGSQGAGLERFQKEWTLWLLLLVLILAVGESALAWLCGRAW